MAWSKLPPAFTYTLWDELIKPPDSVPQEAGIALHRILEKPEL